MTESGGFWAGLLLLAVACQDESPAAPPAPSRAPPKPPTAPPAPSTSAPPWPLNRIRAATRVGKAALIDAGKKESFAKACQIWRSCPALKKLPRCEAGLPIVDADQISDEKPPGPIGSRVHVRGPLGLFGTLVYGTECDESKRCCSHLVSPAFLGTAPRGVFLPDHGCGGDESRQCCVAPAFGETLVASGTLRKIPDGLSTWGMVWELEGAELCQLP